MAGRILSIEIAYGLTKVCEMDYKVKQPKVYQYFSFETPSETISDGQIMNGEEFEKVLMDQLEAHQVKTRKTVFTIASTKIANREITIPYVTDQKIAGLVNANAVDYFPIDLSKYKVTYTILEKSKVKEDKHIKLLVLAVPLTLLESYFAMAERCNLAVQAIDYVGNSIFQLFRNEVDEGVHAIVKIDERNSIITILNHNSVVLQRTIAYGVEEAVNAFREKKEKIEKTGEFTYLEAVEEFRKTECIASEFGQPEDWIVSGQVMESFHYLVNNIARVLDYYISKNPEVTMDSVKLIGIAADFIGLDRLLSHETGLQVEPVRSLTGVHAEVQEDGTTLPVNEFSACIGAGFLPVNLMLAPSKKKKKTEQETTRTTLILFSLLIGVSAFLAGYSILTHYLITRVQKKLTVEISELKPAEEIYYSYKNATSSFNELKTMYQLTTTPNENLLVFIEELEDKLPSQISVLTFNATPTGIDMNIEAPSKEVAAKILMQLRTFESLDEVHSSGITENADDAGKKTVAIDVACTYKMPETAAAETAPTEIQAETVLDGE